jgi:hypothetical protein
MMFGVLTPCRSLGRHQRFRETYCVLLQLYTKERAEKDKKEKATNENVYYRRTSGQGA